MINRPNCLYKLKLALEKDELNKFLVGSGHYKCSTKHSFEDEPTDFSLIWKLAVIPYQMNNDYVVKQLKEKISESFLELSKSKNVIDIYCLLCHLLRYVYNKKKLGFQINHKDLNIKNTGEFIKNNKKELLNAKIWAGTYNSQGLFGVMKNVLNRILEKC
jgi:hypothetical protein